MKTPIIARSRLSTLSSTCIVPRHRVLNRAVCTHTSLTHLMCTLPSKAASELLRPFFLCAARVPGTVSPGHGLWFVDTNARVSDRAAKRTSQREVVLAGVSLQQLAALHAGAPMRARHEGGLRWRLDANDTQWPVLSRLLLAACPQQVRRTEAGVVDVPALLREACFHCVVVPLLPDHPVALNEARAKARREEREHKRKVGDEQEQQGV
mmetsp:Transcript_25720/g.60027  ORF Transcript_25720/g.60027 Transcript_25720/m.60027 type:complete len:209 (-) Transcript_25720:502-1128(-)